MRVQRDVKEAIPVSRVVVALCLFGQLMSGCGGASDVALPKPETKFWMFDNAKAEDAAAILREQIVGGGLRVSVDKYNNQVIATGTAREIARAHEIVQNVDINVIAYSWPTYSNWFQRDASVLLPFLKDVAAFLHGSRAHDDDQRFHPKMVVRHDPIQNRILMFGYGPDSRALLGVLRKIDVE